MSFSYRLRATLAAAAISLLAAPSAHAAGEEDVLHLDPRTGTPQVVARTDGFLTGTTEDGPATAVLGYVRDHADLFGLDADDIDALTLIDRHTTPDGVTHLRWRQSYHGIPAIDSALNADVAPGGRIVAVAGAPRPDLSASTVPAITAAAADATVSADVGRPADSHELVIYETANDGPRLGSRVHAQSLDVIVDARTGAIARKVDRAADAVAASVYENYPGADAGGTPLVVDISGWLTSSTKLDGPNVHAFLDPLDRVPNT